MGFIARAQLASAVSDAGGFGIIETSSGRLDEVRDEMARCVSGPTSPGASTSPRCSSPTPTSSSSWPHKGSGSSPLRRGIRRGTPRSSTTPASPCSTSSRRCAPRRRPSTPASTGSSSKEAKAAASRARDRSRPWSCCHRSAGRSTCRSSPPAGSSTASRWPPPSRSAPKGSRWAPGWSAPPNPPCTTTTSGWSREADATDTVMLSAHSSPAYRVMRTPFSERLEHEPSVVMGRTVGMEGVLKLYFEGDLTAGFAFGGQVAGRVEEILPVEQIVQETVASSTTWCMRSPDSSHRRDAGPTQPSRWLTGREDEARRVVPVEILVGSIRSVGDGLDQQVAAHEGALPGLARARRRPPRGRPGCAAC